MDTFITADFSDVFKRHLVGYDQIDYKVFYQKEVQKNVKSTVI